MRSVQLVDIKKIMYDLLCAVGMNHENAEIFTDVYMRATLRGVGHHDIYDILGRISSFYNKKVNPNPEIQLSSKFEALESYDGNNGPGELCCPFIIKKGMELAEKHGIGFCTIKNSNHFLSAAPYVEKAAEEGYLAMIFTRTFPCMGIPGGSKNLIGNAPMGFATETDHGYSLMLDICLAYASYGNLNAMAAAGESVPGNWGADAAGKPTTDPAAISHGGVPYTIGGHKGFGLALMVEVLTGILSGGQIIDEINPIFGESAGIYSQTAIVIKVDGLIPMETYRAKVSEMIERINAKSPGVRIPGQASFEKKSRFEDAGSIQLKLELIDKMNEWAKKLGIEPL